MLVAIPVEELYHPNSIRHIPRQGSIIHYAVTAADRRSLAWRVPYILSTELEDCNSNSSINSRTFSHISVGSSVCSVVTVGDCVECVTPVCVEPNVNVMSLAELIDGITDVAKVEPGVTVDGGTCTVATSSEGTTDVTTLDAFVVVTTVVPSVDDMTGDARDGEKRTGCTVIDAEPGRAEIVTLLDVAEADSLVETVVRFLSGGQMASILTICNALKSCRLIASVTTFMFKIATVSGSVVGEGTIVVVVGVDGESTFVIVLGLVGASTVVIVAGEDSPVTVVVAGVYHCKVGVDVVKVLVKVRLKTVKSVCKLVIDVVTVLVVTWLKVVKSVSYLITGVLVKVDVTVVKRNSKLGAGTGVVTTVLVCAVRCDSMLVTGAGVLTTGVLTGTKCVSMLVTGVAVMITAVLTGLRCVSRLVMGADTLVTTELTVDTTSCTTVDKVGGWLLPVIGVSRLMVKVDVEVVVVELVVGSFVTVTVVPRLVVRVGVDVIPTEAVVSLVTVIDVSKFVAIGADHITVVKGVVLEISRSRR